MAHLMLYWEPRTVLRQLGDGGLLAHIASEQLNKANPNDIIWITTVDNGEVQVVGRFVCGSYTIRQGLAVDGAATFGKLLFIGVRSVEPLKKCAE